VKLSDKSGGFFARKVKVPHGADMGSRSPVARAGISLL